MLLSLRKSTFQRQQSRKAGKGLKKLANIFNFGNHTMILRQKARISTSQSLALRRLVKRSFKRQAQLWMLLDCYQSVTKKPNEKRLGKGKASVKYWSCLAPSGKAVVELKTGIITNRQISLLSKLNNNIAVKATVISLNTRWLL